MVNVFKVLGRRALNLFGKEYLDYLAKHIVRYTIGSTNYRYEWPVTFFGKKPVPLELDLRMPAAPTLGGSNVIFNFWGAMEVPG